MLAAYRRFAGGRAATYCRAHARPVGGGADRERIGADAIEVRSITVGGATRTAFAPTTRAFPCKRRDAAKGGVSGRTPPMMIMSCSGIRLFARAMGYGSSSAARRATDLLPSSGP
jgi:hypothetical protein